jgi:regulator of protease activity HflC (stomatin/prohibitin superfamily)
MGTALCFLILLMMIKNNVMMMKRIKAYEIGLVFRNGALSGVLEQGLHFTRLFDSIEVYDMASAFTPAHELTVLLKNEKLKSLLHVVEVLDSNIVLLFENKIFKRVLTAGRYAFWNTVIDYSFTKVDLSKIEITEAIEKSVLMKAEVLNYLRAYTVSANEKGLLFVDNQFVKALEPGNYYFWKNSTAIAVTGADMRQQQMEILGQEILTKDKAALRINFTALYRVTDVVKALVENRDYEKQIYILMQLALREYVGGYTLDEVLERKESIAHFALEAVTEKAAALGIEVIGCGIRDIILPGDMKEILNQVLIAEKKAQANTIMRREETASTRSLLNTAKLMEENEMLYKLKEMEYVERIAEKINSISVSGNSQLVDQLKQIFTPAKK